MSDEAKVIPWPGRGYIRVVDGKRTYIIAKRMAGRRWHVSTKRSDPDDAEAEYQRWEKNPLSYTPAGTEPEPGPEAVEPVSFNAKLIEEHLTYSLKPDPSESRRPNSKLWMQKKRRYLSWWAEELRGVDLRNVDLKKHIYPALKGQSCRGHRIAVLKAFFSWLRDSEYGAGVLGSNESRCVELDLHVPQNRPAQQARRRSFSRASHESAVTWLRTDWTSKRKWNPSLSEVCWMADCAVLLSETGWHVTEVHRFIHREDGAGDIETHPAVRTALPDGTQELATKVLVTRQKMGQFHRTRVCDRVAALALALQKNGICDITRLTNKLAEVSETLKLKPSVSPGSYRHSVATWMYDAGVPLADISGFLGHSSPATTKRFYAALGVAINPMLDWSAWRPPAPDSSRGTLRIVPQPAPEPSEAVS